MFFSTPQKLRRMTRILLIACLAFLILLVGFETLPLHVDDDLALVAQSSTQGIISQRIAKDALLMQYGTTAERIQAVSELEIMLPIFESRQAILANDPTIRQVQPLLLSAKADFVSIDTAAHMLLSHADRSADPVQVQIILLHEPSYLFSMAQVTSGIGDEGEGDKGQIFIIELFMNTLIMASVVGALVITERTRSILTNGKTASKDPGIPTAQASTSSSKGVSDATR